MAVEGPIDGARILMEQRVSLSELTSLDEHRLCITQANIDGAVDSTLAKSPCFRVDNEKLQMDAYGACVLGLASAGLLRLYVVEPSRNCAYRIRPEAIHEPHPCWSPFQAIGHGRFIAKSALLRCNSIEAQLDGQPLYASRTDANRAFRIRPTSERILREAIVEVVRLAREQNLKLTNENIRACVREDPRVKRVSDRQIDALASEVKPPDWKLPGPRARTQRRS